VSDFGEVSISFSLAVSVLALLFFLGSALSSSQQHQNSLALYEECEAACSPLQPALVEVNSFSSDEETCFCLGKRGNLKKQINLEYLE
jgi:hypothetical protein